MCVCVCVKPYLFCFGGAKGVCRMYKKPLYLSKVDIVAFKRYSLKRSSLRLLSAKKLKEIYKSLFFILEYVLKVFDDIFVI